jgi:hypothetical protein
MVNIPDTLFSVAPKITNPWALTAYIGGTILGVILVVSYFNLPPIVGYIAISALTFICIFTVGKNVSTPHKEDISEATKLPQDLRVKTEIWKKLDEAFSRCGFNARKRSEADNFSGKNYKFSWAKGANFSLFIVKVEKDILTPDVIFQLRGMKDELRQKRGTYIKTLVICETDQIYDGLHYAVIGDPDSILLTNLAIKNTKENPEYLKTLLTP